MKKIILAWLITATTFAFSTTVLADEAVMQSAKNKIIIAIGTTSQVKNLAIDWGDGHTSAIGDGVESSDITGVKDFSHNYADGKMHTITLTCSNISYLSCISNELTSLSVSNCPDLEYLFCYENQLTNLDIRNCPNLFRLNCSENQLMSLNIGTSLYQLYCYKNKLTDLHINTDFMYILSCGDNRLRSLTFKKPCHMQNSLHCSNNLLTNLDISNMQIPYVYCSNNLLTNLNMSNASIQELDCSNNELTSLDVGMLVGMGLRLLKLNINGCSKLKELICNVDKIEVSSEGCYGLSITSPIPEGTITVNMRNSSGGNVTVITPEGFSDGFHIKGDNFYGKNYKFKVVGKKAGIAGIDRVPASAWAEKVAVMPGYAYIARKVETTKNKGNSHTVSVKFVQLYVIREITSAENENKGGVIGAEVQYRVVTSTYD